jgi:hypothetical protein
LSSAPAKVSINWAIWCFFVVSSNDFREIVVVFVSMRWLGIITAVAAAHVGAGLVIERMLPEPTPVTPEALPAITIEPPAQLQPTEVTLLEATHVEIPVIATNASAKSSSSKAVTAMATLQPEHAAGRSTEPPSRDSDATNRQEPSPNNTGSLSMREQGAGRHFGEKPRLILGSDAPLTPQLAAARTNVSASGNLHPTVNGELHSDQSEFVADVGKDGSVRFKNKKNVSIHLIVPSLGAMGRGFAKWYENPNAGVAKYDRDVERSRFETAVDSDDQRPGHEVAAAIDTPQPAIGASGKFDITSALMKGDAYASKKRKFLDDTRDERMQIAARYREKQLREAGNIMRARLAKLAKQQLEPTLLKQTLFEMWDECIDSGEAIEVQAGAEARKAVMGFIAGHLPATSPIAFTSDDIAAFNRHKQSTEVFQPY